MSGGAIVISAVSATIALGSLVWQVSLYRLSGARVRVELAPAVMTHHGTVFVWTSHKWPTPPKDARIDDQDLWVEVARLRVANLGRGVVWVADLGLDFGRDAAWPDRSRITMTLRPIAVSGGVGDNSPLRLEPGQSASMFVPIADAVSWASAQTRKSRIVLRAVMTFGGMRTQRSRRRDAWRVTPETARYPHAAVTTNTRIYRLLLDAWPSSDISELYQACIAVMVVQRDPSRGSVSDALEPYIPDPIRRSILALRLKAELAGRPHSS